MKLTEIARPRRDKYITIDKEPSGWTINWHESGEVQASDGGHASKEDAKRALKKEYSAEEFAMLREAKVTEAEEDEIIEVCIGYDDHCSIYSVSMHVLKQILNMKNADEINDVLIENGTPNPDLDDNCEHGEIFFDLMNKDVAEFHRQIRELFQ